MSTTFIVVEKATRRFNPIARTWDWYAPESKPLSRKKLRQMMPLNRRGLTGYALSEFGHRAGQRRRVLSPTVHKYSALDGSIVVKPRRIVASAVARQK